MPVLVKISLYGNIKSILAYDSMKTASQCTRGLVSYYDINKAECKYKTYKQSLKVSKLSEPEFQLLKRLYAESQKQRLLV